MPAEKFWWNSFWPLSTATRSWRDPELSEDQRAIINNRIHYLAGHAWSLVKGLELNNWMIDGIVERSDPLVRSLRKHADAILRKLDPGSSPG